MGGLPTSASTTDGLSRTAFVSERVAGTFATSQPNPKKDMKLAINWPNPNLPPDDIYIPYCIDSPAKGWITVNGRYWFYWGAEYTYYNHNGSPNDVRPTCGGEVFGLLPPRSYHAGSVNVLLGDGHVESVADSIQQQVWRALGTHHSSD
jgi:prepilin-type processing-associated H-X9-DG protein